MSEFNNRVAAQRDVLSVVNSLIWTEELFGLSAGAIDRWVKNNNVKEDSALVLLVKEVAEKLFFLSNKSQEQITEEYKSLSRLVDAIIQKLKVVVL